MKLVMTNHTLLKILYIAVFAILFTSCGSYVGKKDFVEEVGMQINYEQGEQYVRFEFGHENDSPKSSIEFNVLNDVQQPQLVILGNDTIVVADSCNHKFEIKESPEIRIILCQAIRFANSDSTKTRQRTNDKNFEINTSNYHTIQLFDSGLGYAIYNPQESEVYSYCGLPKNYIILHMTYHDKDINNLLNRLLGRSKEK